MGLNRQTVGRIKDLLRKYPQGLSITGLSKIAGINRNTAGRYLDQLLLSGQVEMHHFGMAKLFRLSERLPVSAVLSISSELVLQLDSSLRIIFINDPFLEFARSTAKDIVGKNIEYTVISSLFEDVFSDLLNRLREGVAGTEWGGELFLPEKRRFFFCRIVPTVFNEGAKGVSVLFDDVTNRKHDEEQIRQSEARLRSIFKASPVGIGIVTNHIMLEVNDRFCQITGFAEEELIGKSSRMLYPTDEAFDNIASRKYDEIRNDGTSSVETRWVRKDERVIDILLNSTPLDPSDLSGEITFTALDITGRKQAEEALRESEDRYRNLVEISPDAVILHRNGVILYVNPAAVSLLGAKKPEEITGKSVFEFIQPEHREAVRVNIQKDLEGETTPPTELQMLQIDGTPIIVEGRGVMTYLDGKSAVQVALRDITERKRSETQLRESEQRYHQLAESSLDAIIITNLAGMVLTTNQTALEMFEIDMPIDPDRIRVFDFVAPESLETAKQHFFKMTVEKKGTMRTYNAISAKGRQFVVEVIGNIITFGQVPAKIISIRDVSERKQMEADLIENERKYKLLADTSIDIITLQKPDTTAIFVSPAVKSLLGYTPEEIIGKPVIRYVHPEDIAEVHSVIQEFMQGTITENLFVFRIRHRDGHYIWFESTTRIIRDETGAVKELISVSRDITERKQVEEALRESENRYRRLLEQSFDAIAIHKEGKITLVNDATVAILGASSQDQLIGKSIYEFIHPDSQPVAKGRLSNLGTRDTNILPLIKETFVRVDGRPVDVEVMSASFMDNGVPAIQVVFRKVSS